MKTITVWNMKGGVGKTTISFNLAANLAAKGKRVLCLDLDSQANLTSYFETGSKAHLHKENLSILAARKFAEMKKGIYRSKYKNLDFLRGCNCEVNIASIQDMKDGIEQVEALYDYCVLDCHPDFSCITQSALYATDLVLVPINLDGFSRDNLNLVENNLALIEQIREENCLEGTDPEIPYYIISNRVANRRCQKEVYQDLVMRHAYPILDICISESAAVASSTAAHKPLYAHRRFSSVTRDLLELTDTMMELAGEVE